mgnify:FL=1
MSFILINKDRQIAGLKIAYKKEKRQPLLLPPTSLAQAPFINTFQCRRSSHLAAGCILLFAIFLVCPGFVLSNKLLVFGLDRLLTTLPRNVFRGS